jgi:prepilin-type processing-associated H-X9-DG protein
MRNLKPWGHPWQWRDPALGLNQSPDGFGSPDSQGRVHFLMADGSVRTFSTKTSPEVLRALATPNGKEQMPEDWDK